MSQYYVHHNGAAWFVKTADFFKQQGGLSAPWGKAWRPLEARSIEHARKLAPLMFGTVCGTHRGTEGPQNAPVDP